MPERRRRASLLPALESRCDELLRRWAGALALGTLLTLEGVMPAPAFAANVEPALETSVHRSRLDNGLRVVLSRDVRLPTVAICLAYAVGHRHESTGQRGFAHLAAHLMGDGPPAGPEHVAHSRQPSGRMEATVRGDHTTHCQLLAANALRSGVSRLAHGMLRLRVTRQELDVQRAIVLDEAKASERSYDGAERELRRLVFEEAPAYQHDEGSHATPPDLEDLRDATPDTVQRFFEARYAPNEAVLAVAGNFEVVEAVEVIRHQFGGATRKVTGPEPAGDVPRQTAARIVTSHDDMARTAATLSGWAIPPAGTPDHYALELAAVILARGDASRLHQLLVRQESLAHEVEVWATDQHGPNLFASRAILDEGSDPDYVRRLVASQIGAMARFGPTRAELVRAKSYTRATFMESVDGNLRRSARLAAFELMRGDAGLLERELDEYMSVTHDDVQRSVARHLLPNRENRVTVRPGDAGAHHDTGRRLKPRDDGAATPPANP